MLVLTRKHGQSIVIGDPSKPVAVITVESVRGEKVRLKLDAPASVALNRGEIASAIVEERKKGDGGKAVVA